LTDTNANLPGKSLSVVRKLHLLLRNVERGLPRWELWSAITVGPERLRAEPPESNLSYALTTHDHTQLHLATALRDLLYHLMTSRQPGETDRPTQQQAKSIPTRQAQYNAYYVANADVRKGDKATGVEGGV
jgi:hypothetical protein